MKILTGILIFNLLIPSQFVFAKEGGFGCAYSKVPECSGNAKDSHANQYCSYLKAHDTACIQEAWSAVAYTAAAAVCATACLATVTVFGASLESICKIGTTSVAIADTLSSLYVATQVGNDIKDSQAAFQAALSGAGAVGMAIGTSYLSKLGNQASNLNNVYNQATNPTTVTNSSPTVTTAPAPDGGSAVQLNNSNQNNSYGWNQNSNNQNLNANDNLKTQKNQAENKSSKADKTASCLQAGMNTLMASMKWINKAKLVSNADDQLSNLRSVKTAPTTHLAHNNYHPMQTTVDGNAPAPDMADSRGGTNELFIPGEDSLSRIGSSYATASDGKNFPSMSKNDFNNAFKALKDNFGVTPQQFAAAMEQSGPAGAVSKLLGNGPGSDEAKAYFNDIAEKAKSMNGGAPNLAFDKVQNNSGSGKPSGSENPFGALFGDRGPAGINGGGASGVNFGGFKGDIWHAGTTLSIFEIVSRKTNEVSPRLKR